MSEVTDILNETSTGGGGQWRSEPGVAKVKIEKITKSESDPSYTGKPYFDIETVGFEDGLKSTIRLWRATATQSEAAQRVKRSIMKDFFLNADADSSQNQLDPFLNSMIGKSLNVLFRTEEYIGKDKNQNLKPVVKTKLEYAWSKPIGEALQCNQSHLFKGLSDKQRAKFQMDLSTWERDNPGMAQATTTQAAAPAPQQPPAQPQQAAPAAQPQQPAAQPAQQQPVQPPTQAPPPQESDLPPWEQGGEDGLPY